MPTLSHTSRIERRLLQLIQKKGGIRASEATAAGGTRALLGRLVKAGRLVRPTRGMYVLPDMDTDVDTNVTLVQRQIPKGTICLVSALHFHDLTTQIPHEVWMLIEAKAWRPVVDYPPVRLVYASGEALSHGVEEHILHGQRVRMTSKAKTVADCFKYRSKVGLDVALEALRDYRRKRGDLDALWRAAKINRVSRVIRPYLEALA